MLSFPRFKNDPIQKFYDSVVAEKETIIRSKTMKMDDNLPDGTECNEITVEWEEDHIISYTIPKTYALKRPTWDFTNHPDNGGVSPNHCRGIPGAKTEASAHTLVPIGFPGNPL